MSYSIGPRRLPARANAEPRAERGYRDEIERQWDAALARAEAQAAKDAEIQRRIDARKTGNDWLSTIEAAWDVLAERDAAADAQPHVDRDSLMSVDMRPPAAEAVQPVRPAIGRLDPVRPGGTSDAYRPTVIDPLPRLPDFDVLRAMFGARQGANGGFMPPPADAGPTRLADEPAAWPAPGLPPRLSPPLLDAFGAHDAGVFAEHRSGAAQAYLRLPWQDANNSLLVPVVKGSRPPRAPSSGPEGEPPTPVDPISPLLGGPREQKEWPTRDFSDFVRQSLDQGALKQRYTVGRVSDRMVERYRDELGFDATEYYRRVYPDYLRHAMKRHSSTDDIMRGQVPITAEDLVQLPYLLERPDEIKWSDQKSRDGHKVIVSRRRVNGWTYWVEEVVDPSTKQGGRFVFKTIYKFPAANAPKW